MRYIIVLSLCVTMHASYCQENQKALQELQERAKNVAALHQQEHQKIPQIKEYVQKITERDKALQSLHKATSLPERKKLQEMVNKANERLKQLMITIHEKQQQPSLVMIKKKIQEQKQQVRAIIKRL